MSKLLIAALLAVFSTSVLAEWTAVSFSDKQTTYADLSTIRKSGNKVKMWRLYDRKVAETVAANKPFLSIAGQDEYDCKEEISRTLTFTFYSKNMGAGEVVHNSRNLHEEPEPILPGSVAATLFKVACGE